MKKFNVLSVLVTTVIILLMIILSSEDAFAATVMTNRTSGNYTFNITSSGVLTISTSERGSIYSPTGSEADGYGDCPYKQDEYINGITEIVFAEGIGGISGNVIANMPNLVKITLPSTFTSLAANRDGVNFAMGTTLDNCPKFARFVVAENNPVFEEHKENNIVGNSGVLYSKKDKQLIYYPQGKSRCDYIIKDGTESIGKYAFCHGATISDLGIPSSLKTLDTGFRDYNFTVSTLTIIGTSQYFSSEAGILYDKSGKTIMWFPATPAGRRVENYEIKSAVTTIGNYAFANNPYLKKIVIPETVTSVGDRAFYKCSSLEEVSLSGSASYGYGIFSKCSSLKTVKFPEYVSKIFPITSYMFSECTSLETIAIGYNCKEIGTAAFLGCTKLKSIFFPKTLEKIGSQAFTNTSLEIIDYAGDANSFAKVNIEGEHDEILLATCHYIMYSYPVKANPCERDSIQSSCRSCNKTYLYYTSAGGDHIYPNEWTFDAANHWKICGCGENTIKYAHDLVEIVDKDPDIGIDGSKHKECTDCKYKSAQIVIPALKASIKNGTVISDTKSNLKYIVVDAEYNEVYVKSVIDKKKTKITIPATIKYMGQTLKVVGIKPAVFKNNKVVEEITIGSKVMAVGSKAFYGCKNLKKLNIKSTKLDAAYLQYRAFYKIPKTAIVRVPGSKKKEYTALLQKKGLSKYVSIKKLK